MSGLLPEYSWMNTVEYSWAKRVEWIQSNQNSWVNTVESKQLNEYSWANNGGQKKNKKHKNAWTQVGFISIQQVFKFFQLPLKLEQPGLSSSICLEVVRTWNQLAFMRLYVFFAHRYTWINTVHTIWHLSIMQIIANCYYHLAHKKRGSVFLAYLQFLSSKFKKLYEFYGKNQII